MTSDPYHQGFLAGLEQGKADSAHKKDNLLRRALLGFAGLVTAFIGGVLTSGTTTNGLCELATTPVERLSNITCSKEHQQVSQLEAEAVFDQYLGMTSGAQPENAWSLLAPNLQEQQGSQEEFAAKFDNVLWFERFKDIKRVSGGTAFNRFTVQYLAYTGPNPEHPDIDVNWYRREVQLTRSDTVTLIRDLSAAVRVDTLTWWYPNAHTASFEEVPEDMRAYGAPTTEATYGSDPTLAHGGLIRPICTATTTEGTWVYAPGSGWIPDKFLDGGTRDLKGMVDCDPHLLPNADPAPPTVKN